MDRRTWKRVESELACLLGGERVPVSGRARESAPDVSHPWLSVEVKARTKLPGWIEEALQQATAAALVHQLPLVVLHQANRPHAKDVVLLRLEDFLSWFDPAGSTGP